MLESVNFNEKLLKIINEKQSCLCLSIDCKGLSEMPDILDKYGKYICMLKLHIDLLEVDNYCEGVDYTDEEWSNFAFNIKHKAAIHNFLIMDDAKLSDVGTINCFKMSNNLYKTGRIDCTTCCWYNYENTLKVMENFEELKNIELIPVCEMNINNSMKEYVISPENGINYNDILVGIFLNKTMEKTDKLCIVTQTQHKDKENNVLRLTPGVVELEEEANNLINKHKRSYRSIKQAIEIDKNHVVIIGSNILKSNDSLNKCKNCALKSWEHFKNTFPELVK